MNGTNQGEYTGGRRQYNQTTFLITKRTGVTCHILLSGTNKGENKR